jgi:hypothetical protein
MGNLEKASSPFGVDVIRNGRASRGNRFGKHSDDGLVQPARSIGTEAGRTRERVNTRAKKRFVGINIANAAEKRLIEKQRFYAGFSSF